MFTLTNSNAHTPNGHEHSCQSLYLRSITARAITRIKIALRSGRMVWPDEKHFFTVAG